MGLGLAFVLGIVMTAPLEWAWHAHVGHGRRADRSRELHLQHHRDACEVMAPWREIAENLPRIAVVLGVANVAAAFAGVLAWTLPFALGLVVGYALVTLAHAEMHLRAPRSRWERFMWRFHWHHHAANARVNFGLTNPLFDFAFGTAVVPDVVEVHERMAPPWLRAAREVDGIRLRQSGPSS